MFCEQCGTKLEEDAIFCFNCGAKVVSNVKEYDDDDDKTVILQESDFQEETESQEEGQPAGSSAAEETEPEETEPAKAMGPAETEPSAAPEAAVDTEAEAARVSGTSDTGAETVETVEISPTGVVETGTAMMVPEAAEQKKFCPNCGAANAMNDLFCQQCGMFFGNTAEKMGGADATGKKHKKGFSWKTAAIVATLLVVIGLGIVFAPRILGGMTSKGDDLDFVMYVKDNELTMARKNKYDPVVIGDKMVDDPENSSFEPYLSGNPIIQYSPDHQYVYYPQKAGDEDFELYRKKLGSKKAEAEKIDSHVTEYKVIDNDKLVYIKDSTDRKLYLYRKGESEKIASDAWGMRVSADGKYVMWLDDDNRLYVQDTSLKADKIKLDSDVFQICEVSDDFNTIVYLKEDKLYVMKGMDEKEKIASGVYRAYVYDINGSLKMYYLKTGDQVELSYYDLVDDDCLVQDQQIAEPRIEDYQRVTYKDSFWGTQKSVEVDDSYYEEMEKYQEKKERDNLRDSLENRLLDMEECEVYYYEDASGESDKVMTVLGQKYGVTPYGSAAKDSAMMYAYTIDREKIEMIKFSKLTEAAYDEIESEVTSRLSSGGRLMYVENGEAHEIEDYEGDLDYSGYGGVYINVWANEEKRTLYISEHGDEGKLYSLAYGQKDASLELITDELQRVVSYGMDEICYINNDEELYYGDAMIAEDVGACQVREEEMILYLTDMDKNGNEGTLHLYQNGKDTEIADDVADGGYGIFDTGKIAFLTDYNYKKYRGDLNVFDGKKVTNIDSDVTSIIF